MVAYKWFFKIRKGQTEIVGLLAIVILLIFLGMVYLGFVSFREESILPTLRTNIEAENALKAVMKVEVEENAVYGTNMKVEEILVNCRGDISLCVVLEGVLNDIYGQILAPNEDFSFAFYADNEKIYEFGTCGLGVVASYSFIKDYVFYDVKLKLCKS